MRKKRLLSLVLTVALVLGCVTIPTSGAFAAETANGVYEGFTWSVNPGTGVLKISGEGLLSYGPWDEYKESIQKVELAGKITSIGRYAFKDCTKLNSIVLPKSVTMISYGAFDHCGSLKTIKLPASLESIDTGAFIFCRSLSKVEVNKGANNTKLKSIGMKAFGGCTKLKSLTIPKKVNSIGEAAYGYDLTEDHTLKERKVKDATIYGIKGTEAQSYAKANKITFKSVKNTGASILTAPKLTAYTGKINGKGSHVLKFTKVKGATGYQIYFSFSGNANTWRKLQSFKTPPKKYELQWDNGGGLKCYYKVRAYKKVGSKYIYSPFSAVKMLK